MVNRRFQEVAGGIAFVIAARRWVPMLQDGDHLRNVGIGRGSSGASRPHRRGYGEGRLQVSIGIPSSRVARIFLWASMISGSPCGSIIRAMLMASTVWWTHALEKT